MSGTDDEGDPDAEELMPEETLDSDQLRFLGIRAAAILVFLVFAYLTRPLWHNIVYTGLYSPVGVVMVVGGALVGLVLVFLSPSRLPGNDGPDLLGRGRSDDESILLMEDGSAVQKLRLFFAVMVVLFTVSLGVAAVSSQFEKRALAERTMEKASEVEEFPSINPQNPRVVPQKVSDVTTRGESSYRQHRLGASDIARRENGSLAWSYPIEPEGFRNTLVENQRGVMIADLTRINDRPTAAYDETEFTYGEGMFLHRSAEWQLKKTDFFAQYPDDPVEFTHDGTPYLYYPKVIHTWKLFPFPHTVPTWKGGALVTPDGTITHMTPQEAQQNEILDGQRLYPLTLTQAEMGSLSYRNGIINQMGVVGSHRNQVEVASLPDEADNTQPFVIDLAGEQLSYVTAMEPYGETSRGLDEVWFANAETGEYTYFATGGDTLTGPERAMGIARSEDSQTNWGENFVVTEPVPVIVDEDLWWQIKVSPTDYTDVTRNVFVNANSGEPVAVRTDEAIRAFIRGEADPRNMTRVPENQTGSVNGTQRVTRTDDGPVYYVLVTDENGTVVDRIPVRPGQNTTIVSPGDPRLANETG